MPIRDLNRFRGYIGGLLGGISRSYATASGSGNYPNVEILGITDTSIPHTITLQSIQIGAQGFVFEIKDESGGANANNITIATEGGEKIDGVDTIAITEDFGSVRGYSNGSDAFSL